MTVKLTPTEPIVSAMEQIKQMLEREIFFKDLSEVVDQGKTMAMEQCPVLTGALRNSIGSEVSPNTARLFVEAEYAPYVNFGHHTRSGSFVPPQPFFTSATEYIQKTLPQRVMEDVTALLASQSAMISSVTKILG
jgi:hypothetical protein